MNKLRKCPLCKTYTLKEICEKCGKKTEQAGYKYVRVKYISENNK